MTNPTDAYFHQLQCVRIKKIFLSGIVWCFIHLSVIASVYVNILFIDVCLDAGLVTVCLVIKD